jgi:hypothetical protein
MFISAWIPLLPVLAEPAWAATQRIEVRVTHDVTPGFYWCQHYDGNWSTYSSFRDQWYYAPDAGGQPAETRVSTQAEIAPPENDWAVSGDQSGKTYQLTDLIEPPVPIEVNAHITMDPNLHANPYIINNMVIIEGTTGPAVKSGRSDGSICGHMPGYIYPFPVTVTWKGYIEITIPDEQYVGLEIVPTSSTLYVGETQQFVVYENWIRNGVAERNQVPNNKLTWSSNQASRASVNPTGLVTGLQMTTTPATITATHRERNDSVSATVTVIERPTYIITGDFDILPSSTINYRDSFTLKPKHFVIPNGCTYLYHEYRIQKDGSPWTSPRINSQSQNTSYSYATYPPNVGVGSNFIQIKITANCGSAGTVDSGWTAGKYLFIQSPADNQPPQFSVGFFKEYNRTGWTPDTEVVVGTRVNLRVIHDPTKDPAWPYDPDGDPITYTWLFESGNSDWIRSLPSEYGLYRNAEAHYNLVASTLGYHSVTVIARDPFGGESRKTAYINVIPENPIPVIDGPKEVKENRPLPKPFDGSRSYSPIGRKIVEYEWENKKDRYETPGTETIRLHVVDSGGLRSLGPAVHTLTVLPDEPPVARLEADPLAIRGQTIELFNKSYSPDRDEIVSAAYRYRYDNDNNGFEDDPWQPLAGNLAKTELAPDKVGKYEVEVTVTEDYGKQGTSSIVVDVVNLAPSVSFRIEGKNEQPAPENKTVYDAATILNSWSLYRVNSTTPITGKLQRWQNENGRLTGLLGRGMENLAIYNTRMLDTGNYRTVMAVFQDYGYGNNGISPYRAIQVNNPSYSQPLPLPRYLPPGDPQQAELVFDTNWGTSSSSVGSRLIDRIATNPKYLYLVKETYLLALNKSKIGTYHYTTHVNYMTHHWHNGSPYDFVLQPDSRYVARQLPNISIKFGQDSEYTRTYDPALLDVSQTTSYVYPNNVSSKYKVGPKTIYQFNTLTITSSSSTKYVWEINSFDAFTGEKIANNFDSGFYGLGNINRLELMMLGDDLIIKIDTGRSDVFIRLNRHLQLVSRHVLDLHQIIDSPRTYTRYEVNAAATDEEGNLYQLYQLRCTGHSSCPPLSGLGNFYMEKISLTDGQRKWRIPIGDNRTSLYCGYGAECSYLTTEQANAAPIVVNNPKNELLIRYYVMKSNGNGMEPRYMLVKMSNGSTQPISVTYNAEEANFYVDHAGNYVTGVNLFRTPFSYTAERNLNMHTSTSGPGGHHSWTAGGLVELYGSGARTANPSTSIWRVGFYVGDGLYLSFHPDSFGANINYLNLIPWITKGTPTASPLGFNPTELGQFVSTESFTHAEFEFSMRMKLPGVDTNLAGFSFRMADPRNRYAVETNGTTLYLSKYTGGNRTVLQSIPFTWQADRDYAIRVKTEGNRIQVFVGGVPYFDVTDNTFTSGKFGPFSLKPYVDFSAIIRKETAEPTEEWITGYAIWEDGSARAEVRYTNLTFTDPENDPMAGSYRWTIEHTPKFLNNQGVSALHGRTFSAEVAEFDKVGLYRISLRARDDPHPDYRHPSDVFADYRKSSNEFWQMLIVHRRPVAQFTLSIHPTNKSVVWSDTSYDPDRWLSPTNYSTEATGIDYAATRGILERKYYYVTPSGQTVNQKLVTPTETGIYTVGLSVKDEYGAWSHWAIQTIEIASPAAPDNPPVAGFTVTPTTGYRGTTFTITSTAYDQEDGPAANLQHAYYIRNVTEGTPETLQSMSRGTWTKVFNSLGVMEIRQVVTDSKGQTAQAIRVVTVANRKPVARFEWSPKMIWEGDPVSFQNTSFDPDGDPLTHAWQIRTGSGTLLHTSDSLHTSFRFREPGTYTVTLVVSDGIDVDQTTQVILVSPLSLEADIFHTPEWLAYHQERGHRTAEAPRQFYAGERMLLQARHTEAPYERITARLDATGRDGRPLILETVLSPSDTPGLAVGELADERLQSLEKGLPTGIHQVVFFIRYANGVEKSVTVPFEIIGHVLGTVQVHRVR